MGNDRATIMPLCKRHSPDQSKLFSLPQVLNIIRIIVCLVLVVV